MKETKKEAKNFVAPIAGNAISERILVAEDNRSIKLMVSKFLEFLGFKVALAGDGLEAFSLFLKTSIDLVLTDLEMPFMDGLTLARRIKEQSPYTPIVLMTGSDRETTLRNAEGSLVDSVIFKPFAMEDLQNTLQRALELRK